jgi:hypothetical protein
VSCNSPRRSSAGINCLGSTATLAAARKDAGKPQSPSAANKSGSNIIDHHPLNDNKDHWNKKQSTLSDLFVICPTTTSWLFQCRNHGQHK